MSQYVIWSFEHHAWWAPGHMGYTTVLDAAGRYTEEEAREIVEEANIPPGIEHERMLTLEDAMRDGPPTE